MHAAVAATALAPGIAAIKAQAAWRLFSTILFVY